MTSDGRRYRVLGVLGRGGFGTVYRAEMLGEGGFRRQVALKMLNSDMDAMPEIAQRLRDEARLLGMLRHRAILQGDGLVVLDDRWTVVMEYIDGVDLQLISRKGPVPVGCVLEIVGEVASALHVAYSQPTDTGEPLKLIHRDIKPSNILLTAIGETKVLDFGIARANFAGREARTKGMRFGSPGYMAPERLDFEEGPAGDVYALGVLVAELVTGEPFGHTSVRPDRHQALIDTAAGRMRALGVPDEVITFMAELVAYEPSARPVARDVERRCRELRGRLPPPWLRDWAEEIVPPILNLRGLGSIHDLSNSVLVERSGGTTSATMHFDGPEITEPGTPIRPLPTYSDEDAPPKSAGSAAPATATEAPGAIPPPRPKTAGTATSPGTVRDAAPPQRPKTPPPAPAVSTVKPLTDAEVPPPKVKIDAAATPAPARSRGDGREAPKSKTESREIPPPRPKTETRDPARPVDRGTKTETIEAMQPKRPRTGSGARASSGTGLATAMGVASAIIIVLCVIIAVAAVIVCAGFLATGP